MLAIHDHGQSIVFGLLGRRSTRLQHLLHEVEPDASLAFVFGDGKIVEEIVMTHVGCTAVSVLIHEPLVPGSVGMACPDVLGL